MVISVIQRRAQTARPAVLRGGDDVRRAGAGTVNGNHSRAVIGAQDRIKLLAHDVQVLIIRGQGLNRIAVHVHGKRIAPVVHHGKKIISAFVLRGGEQDEIRQMAGNNIVRVDGHKAVAVGTLVFVAEAERVAKFVADDGMIPRAGADLEQLRAAAHADGRKPAAERRIIGDEDVICLGRAQEKMQVRKRRPLGGAVEKNFLIGRHHRRVEGVIDIAARPRDETVVKRALRLRHAGEFVAPGLQVTQRNHHVANLNSVRPG